MTTRRYTLSNIILYILLFGIIFYIQHAVTIDLDDPFRFFNLTETIVLFLILLLVGAWYFIYEYKARGLKLNFPLTVILLAFFIVATITIILYPESSQIDVPISSKDFITHQVYIPLEHKVLFILIEFMALLFIYIFLAVLPLKVHCTKQLNIFFYGAIALAIAACVYSFVFESDVYQAFFDDPVHLYWITSKSFTNNSNNFAMILMFGSVACLFLNHTIKGFWWYILAIFFYVLIFPTKCRTNIASCGLIIFGYCLIRIILTYRKHPYINSLIVFAILFSIGVLLISYHFYVENGMIFNSKLIAKIYAYIDYEFKSMVDPSRRILWDRVIVLLNQGYWVAGLGFGLFSSIYTQITVDRGGSINTDSPHNGYYQVMGCGGWLLISFLTIALVYMLWMMIRIFRRHKTLVLFTIFLLGGFGFHLITEAATPLIPSSPLGDCLALTFFTFVPIYATYYHECHTNLNRSLVEEAKEFKENKISFRKPFAIAQGMSLIGVLAFGVVASLLHHYSFDLMWIIIAIGLLVLAIGLPLGVEALIQRKNFKFVSYLKEVFIPYFILAVLYGGLTIGLQILLNASYLLEISFTVGLIMIYVGVFAVIPYYGKRAGVVLSSLDVLTRLMERHLAKKIPVSNKKPRLTLYEKVTRLVTPKIFRNEP